MINVASVSLLLSLILIGCNQKSNTDTVSIKERSPKIINYKVIDTYPHDTNAFTEGLFMHNGQLYESTGSPSDLPETKSVIGIANLSSGSIETKVELDKTEYFGEGIALLNNKIYQLTYTTKIGFVYDAQSYKKIKEFTYPNKEGWGLTTDGRNLIMSDGTNTLTFLDSVSLKVVKTLSVNDNAHPIDKLNELEFIKGFIYANVYGHNYIVKIDPATGAVVGKLDLVSLAQDAKAKNLEALEMNGIAYNPLSGNMYITGKFWTTIYEIRFAL